MLLAAGPAEGSRARGAHLPCAAASLRPDGSDLPRISAAVLCLVNRERLVRGIAALHADGDLQRSARSHTLSMVERDYLGHGGPGAQTPFTRARAAGYMAHAAAARVGENIAYGTGALATPAAVVAAWMASPSHRANILDPAFRETGVGVVAAVPAAYSGGQAGATYTQDFGARVRG